MKFFRRNEQVPAEVSDQEQIRGRTMKPLTGRLIRDQQEPEDYTILGSTNVKKKALQKFIPER